MHLIVGLGNPGDEYRHNRHNIGFMAVDEIARHHNFSPFKSKFDGLICEGTIEGERCLLLKPQTFMNLSGKSVGAAAKFYKIPPADITVIYDELDITAGRVKIKTGGGNGGHNGLRSIDPVIGKDYQRLRLGIGHPGHKELVTRHVLGNFAKSDSQWLENLLDAIARNFALLLGENGPGKFMNKIALATGTEAPDNGKKKQNAKPQATKSENASKQAPTTATKPSSNNKDADDAGPMAAMLKKLFPSK